MKTKKPAAQKPAAPQSPELDLSPLELALRGVAKILANTYGESAVETDEFTVRVLAGSIPQGLPALPAAELIAYAIEEGLVVAATLKLDVGKVPESRLLEVLASNNSSVPMGTFARLPKDPARLMFKVGLPGQDSEHSGALLADTLAWVQTVARSAHRFLPEELGMNEGT